MPNPIQVLVNKLPASWEAAALRSIRTFGQTAGAVLGLAVMSTLNNPSFIGVLKAVGEKADYAAGVGVLAAVGAFVQNKKAPISPEQK